jgi:hypothetical protein
LGQPTWSGTEGAHQYRSSSTWLFRVESWESQDVARSREHWPAADPRASPTPVAILGCATAELVGTDSGAATAGCLLAQSKLVKSRWRNKTGPGAVDEPATDNPGSWHIERGRRACSRVGWNSQPSARRNRVALVGFAACRMPVGNFTRWGQGLSDRCE